MTQPALAGLEFQMGFVRVYEYLEKAYGGSIADAIFSGNARRVLEHWGHKL